MEGSAVPGVPRLANSFSASESRCDEEDEGRPSGAEGVESMPVSESASGLLLRATEAKAFMIVCRGTDSTERVFLWPYMRGENRELLDDWGPVKPVTVESDGDASFCWP